MQHSGRSINGVGKEVSLMSRTWKTEPRLQMEKCNAYLAP